MFPELKCVPLQLVLCVLPFIKIEKFLKWKQNISWHSLHTVALYENISSTDQIAESWQASSAEMLLRHVSVWTFLGLFETTSWRGCRVSRLHIRLDWRWHTAASNLGQCTSCRHCYAYCKYGLFFIFCAFLSCRQALGSVQQLRASWNKMFI